MKRGSVVGPLILIVIGVLFLVANLRPDMSVPGMLARLWPFLLIVWGSLRLLEILVWTVRSKPLPAAGISGGEWFVIIFLTFVGSGSFFVFNRSGWHPLNMRIHGVEMLGEAFDYAIPEMSSPGGKAPRVVIENLRGNARITGSNITDVRLSGRKTVRALDKNEADRASDKVRFEVVREGETIYVRPAVNKGISLSDNLFVTTDLEIAVPKDARIEAHGRRGDFDVTDVNGSVEVVSDNAGVRLQNIGGGIRVDLRASDIVRAIGVRGDIEVKGSGHDIELENIEGQVVVGGNYAGDLQFRNITRPVRFEGGMRNRSTEWRVEACPGQIRMSRGNLALENVTGPVTVTAQSKDVQISGFTQGLDLKLNRGDVEVRSPVPVPRMNIVTTGNVDLSLPENGKFELRGTVEKGEVENDFGGPLQIREEGRGAVVTGSTGTGNEVRLHTDRGSLRIRKATAAEATVPMGPPPAPRKPLSPEAVRSLKVERN